MEKTLSSKPQIYYMNDGYHGEFTRVIAMFIKNGELVMDSKELSPVQFFAIPSNHADRLLPWHKETPLNVPMWEYARQFWSLVEVGLLLLEEFPQPVHRAYHHYAGFLYSMEQWPLSRVGLSERAAVLRDLLESYPLLQKCLRVRVLEGESVGFAFKRNSPTLKRLELELAHNGGRFNYVDWNNWYDPE